jgi:hypothetical protein
MTTVAKKIMVSRMYPGAKTLDERLQEVAELERSQPILQPNILENAEKVTNPWEDEDVSELPQNQWNESESENEESSPDEESYAARNVMQTNAPTEETFARNVQDTAEEVFDRTKELVESAAKTGFIRTKWNQAQKRTTQAAFDLLENWITFLDTVSFQDDSQSLQNLVDDIKNPKEKSWIDLK